MPTDPQRNSVEAQPINASGTGIPPPARPPAAPGAQRLRAGSASPSNAGGSLREVLRAGSTACPQDFVQRCRRAGRSVVLFLGCGRTRVRKKIDIMLIPGLTSVSFRKLSCSEIITMAKKAGLACVEWGSDIHVPYGNIVNAREVQKLMDNSGLYTSSYGSYYSCGFSNKDVDFEKILETAIELKAPTIRVWAGKKSSADCTPEEFKAVVRDSRYIADLAHQADIAIAFEFHANTLNDHAEATIRLMNEINRSNVGTYWQTTGSGIQFAECLTGLKDVLPWLQNIHVSHHNSAGLLPLEEGKEIWRAYLKTTTQKQGRYHALIEFVRNNDPEALANDANTLKILCEQ